MSTQFQSISARLRQQVADQRLTFDPSQQAAAQHLDDLSLSLAANARSVGRRLRDAMHWLPAPRATPAIRGLYLWGGVGRGKTLLMDLFFESLRGGRRERKHFYRFMRDVHAEMRAVKNQEDPLDTVAQRMAARVRVICLDEFFVADIADAMILSGLLTGLFRRGVTLVTTSNVPPQDLYRDGLQRRRFLPAIRLLEQHVDVIHLDGGIDYRLRQLQQAPTYLDSAQPAAAAQMRQRFAALAGDAALRPTTLRIEGRPIDAMATAPGMAWFEFAAICEGPRSQNDYIELARLYHTVFISNIPLFTVQNENAARRFIMLIDEFYDRNVKVVMSAAAAPDVLYHGDRLQFEFQRAASRLIEMQSQQYLSGEHRP